MKQLKAPWPWFGGKSRASALVWDRLGNVPNYCEPFAGANRKERIWFSPHCLSGLQSSLDLSAYPHIESEVEA